MREYREAELLRLAKRHHNTKRRYLLVNPLQGKHIPVAPSACLEMLGTLGEKLAAAAPEIDLVIGFAETATAVGAVVATCLGEGCVYAHTTREAFLRTAGAVPFQEEHSHATDQYLCMENFRAALGRARAVAFVDDEISTGKTLLNIIRALREVCPELNEKPVWVASIINRLNAQQRARLRSEGISDCSLLNLPQLDYEAAVEGYAIHEAAAPEPVAASDAARCAQAAEPAVRRIDLPPTTSDARRGVAIPDDCGQCAQAAEPAVRRIDLPPTTSDARRGVAIPDDCRQCAQAAEPAVRRIDLPPTTSDVRRGVAIADYRRQCALLAASLAEQLKPTLAGKRVTVLGTEEYMYPGLMLGAALEAAECCASLRFHATTRSPIGVCADADYPIRSGFRLASFYEAGRTTYIYNLQPADAALILTDSPDDGAAEAGLRDLSAALRQSGCGEIICIREAEHVR